MDWKLAIEEALWLPSNSEIMKSSEFSYEKKDGVIVHKKWITLVNGHVKEEGSPYKGKLFQHFKETMNYMRNNLTNFRNEFIIQNNLSSRDYQQYQIIWRILPEICYLAHPQMESEKLVMVRCRLQLHDSRINPDAP